MNSHKPLIILPSQVEGWISGVTQVEIAADDMVTVHYESGSQISARLEALPHAVQTNFFTLVRRVQNAARASGQPLGSPRLA